MGVVLMVLGGIVALVGYIQGIMAGFQRETVWGVLNLLFSPITPLIMAMQGQMSWRPILLMVVGSVLLVVGQMITVAEMMGGMRF